VAPSSPHPKSHPLSNYFDCSSRSCCSLPSPPRHPSRARYLLFQHPPAPAHAPRALHQWDGPGRREGQRRRPTVTPSRCGEAGARPTRAALALPSDSDEKGGDGSSRVEEKGAPSSTHARHAWLSSLRRLGTPRSAMWRAPPRRARLAASSARAAAREGIRASSGAAAHEAASKL
jgi:hypothetical protein